MITIERFLSRHSEGQGLLEYPQATGLGSPSRPTAPNQEPGGWGAPGQPQLGAGLRLVQDMAHRQAQLGGAHGRTGTGCEELETSLAGALLAGPWAGWGSPWMGRDGQVWGTFGSLTDLFNFYEKKE